MEQNNINQAEIVPEIPVFRDTPTATKVTPEIESLGNTIRNRAVPNASGSLRNPLGADLNSLISLGKENKITLNKFDVGREAFIPLSDGKLISRFEKFLPGINNEEFLARKQTTSEKWANGATKFLGKTFVNVLGGTIGTVEGLINGVRNQSLSAIFNSDFNKYLDDLNTKLDFKLPNYYSEQEKGLNFGQKLGTANFWANDFLGGVSFLTGTIISEGLWAAATGGTSLITTPGRVGLKLTASGAMKALRAVKAPGKAIIKAGLKTSADDLVEAGIKSQNFIKGLQTGRFIITSAGFEAGVEARQFIKESTEAWEAQFREQNGRNPTPEERATFNNSTLNSANALFASNVALVGTSNLTVLGRLFLNRAPSKSISNNIFKKLLFGVGFKKLKDGGIKEIEQNAFQKAFSKVHSFGKGAFTEGFVEEGGQAVLSNAATDYTLSAFDKDNVDDSLSLMDSLIEGFKHTYGTKEGLSEVGLGALIGILGGGIATNFRFNDISNEREQIKNTADFVNEFTRDNLIENLKFGAKMRKATIDGEKARREGNLTNEMRSDMAAMTAVAERAYHFENKDDTIDDFFNAIDSIDNEALIEQHGLTLDEVKEWKNDKKAQFRNVMETHTRNLQFAESIVGSTPIAGINNIDGLDKSGVADLKGAIAFTLTMGTKSDEFAESLANQIKLTLSKDLITVDNLDSISVNEALRKVSKTKSVEYGIKANKLSKLQSKLDKLTKAKIEADNVVQLSDKESNKKARERVVKIQDEIIAVQEALEKARIEKTAAFEALNIPQLTDEVITEEMLDRQKESILKIATTIESITQTDPQRGELLKNLYLEYSRAVDNTKRFNELVRGILDPKIRVNTLSGWVGKIINSKKAVNGDTAQLFVNMVNTFQEKNQGRNQVIKDETEQADDSTKNKTEENTNKDPLATEPDKINKKPEASDTTRIITDVKEIINKLKAAIKDMVQRDPYTNLEYRGQELNFDEIAPKQEELDRYNELLGKIKPGTIVSTILQRPFNKGNNRGLTQEETEELQKLNKKLNNWKILSGFLNENDDSVAELLQLIKQLETDVQPEKKKIKVEPREIPTSLESKSGLSRDNLTTVVTVDIAVAKK